MKHRIRTIFPLERGTHRRGAMLALIALCLLVILMFVALSVDVAYMQMSRTELRAATDAAARAASEALSRTQKSSQARQAAINTAKLNMVAGRPLLLSDDDVVVGRMEFNPDGKWDFFPGETPYNGIRVFGRRTDASLSGPVGLFFGGLTGSRDFETQASALAAHLDRDIALVVDHSGSMRWNNRWRGLRQAVRVFIQELETTDQDERVSLSGYSSSAALYQPLTDDLARIQDALDNLRVRGQTNIGGGLRVGSDSLEDFGLRREFAAKVIVLMTDGNHNTGTNPLSVTSLCNSRDHTVHAISFGRSANQRLMREVAEATGGSHYHALNNTELIAVFREIALTVPVVLAE